MQKIIGFMLAMILVLSFAACSSRVNTNESSAMIELEADASEKSEPEEEIEDGDIYPIVNADPLIGAFASDLRHTYNEDLANVLNQWLDAHRNETFEEIINHHPIYPSDFPPASQLPVIDNTEDFIIAWRETVIIDANTEMEGVVYIIVPIDRSHIYVLQPALFSDVDDSISIGFAYSGFHAMGVMEFMADARVNSWLGGEFS